MRRQQQSSEQVLITTTSLYSKRANSQLAQTRPSTSSDLVSDELEAILQMQPFFESANLEGQNASEMALKTFQSQGPLNLQKLVADSWLKIKRDNYKSRIIPFDLKLNPDDEVSQYGQQICGEVDGIARRVGFGGKIFEGQFKRGNQSGWGRRILSDGTYHVGWFKGGMAHGYGIGNAYTNKKGVQIGLYQESRFKSDSNVSYDKECAFTKRFSLNEVGLELQIISQPIMRKQKTVILCSKSQSQVSLSKKNSTILSPLASNSSQSTQVTEVTFKVPSMRIRTRTPVMSSNDSSDNKQYVIPSYMPLRGDLTAQKSPLVIKRNEIKPPLKPPKAPRTIIQTKSKVKQLIEFKSAMKSKDSLSSRDFNRYRSSDTMPTLLQYDEIKACEEMQPFFNSPNLIDQRSRVKAASHFKKHGPLNLKKLAADGWLKLKKDFKDKGIIQLESLVNYKQSFTYGSTTKYGQLSDYKEDGVSRRVETDPGLFLEGQFVNGMLSGWGREIQDDGTYHIGWFKDGKAHGYGIGNRYSNNQGLKKGFYENGYYKSEEYGIFKRSSQPGRKFTLEQVGLKKHSNECEGLKQDITPRPRSNYSRRIRL